jgi:AraC-like DNA-binding protein
MITLHGFLLSALMAIGQLIINRRSSLNLLYFGLFITFSLFEIDILLFKTGLAGKYRLLLQLSTPALCLLGPLLYLLTRFSLNKGFNLRKNHQVHFIPLIASLGLMSAGIILYPPEETLFLPGYFYNSVTMAAGICGSLTLFVYLALTGRMIVSSALWNRELLKREPASAITLILYLMIGISWIIDLLSVVTNDLLFIEISITLLSFTIIFLFLVNFFYPEFYRTVHRVVEMEKDKRSYLSGLDLEVLDLGLTSAMNEKELFADDEMSLNKLAGILNITPHQLSEYINERFHKNFTAYINEFRIKKAKDLLLSKNSLNILDIAFEVGFRSKSRFNSVFLKHTGETPSRFRQRNR